MRRFGAVVVILLLLIAGGLFFLNQSKPTAPLAGENAASDSSARSPETSVARQKGLGSDSSGQPFGASANPAAAPASLADNAGEMPPPTNANLSLPPATVLANVRTAIRQYGDMFGGNPVGTNPEITSALNRNNPKQINFINEEAGMRINDRGELVDPWGTPYFFHQLSGTEMEIHSAGPDRKMWTADDLIGK